MSQGQRALVTQVGHEFLTGRVTRVSCMGDVDLKVRIHVDGGSEETFRFVVIEEAWRRVHSDPYSGREIFYPEEPVVQIETWW